MSWGQGTINNSIGWGQGSTNDIGWGSIYADSPSGDTAISAPSYSNVYSAEFDGADSYIATDATYGILDGIAKASISIWVKPISSATTARMVFDIGRAGSTGLNSQLNLWLFEGNRIDYSVYSAGAWCRGDITAITYGSWNNILLTFDLAQAASENKTKIYVNGADATTANNLNYSSFVTSTTALHIGESSIGSYYPFYGNIDEMAVWQGVELTSADAVTIYNSGTPTDLSEFSTPPTNWWRMGDSDSGEGTTLTDAIGSADATLINDTAYTTDVPT